MLHLQPRLMFDCLKQAQYKQKAPYVAQALCLLNQAQPERTRPHEPSALHGPSQHR